MLDREFLLFVFGAFIQTSRIIPFLRVLLMIFFYFEILIEILFIAESFFAWRKMAVSRRLM